MLLVFQDHNQINLCLSLSRFWKGSSELIVWASEDALDRKHTRQSSISCWTALWTCRSFVCVIMNVAAQVGFQPFSAIKKTNNKNRIMPELSLVLDIMALGRKRAFLQRVSFSADFFSSPSFKCWTWLSPLGWVMAFSMTTAVWHGSALEGRAPPLGGARQKHDRVSGHLPSSTSHPSSSLSPSLSPSSGRVGRVRELERERERESWSEPTQSRPGKHGALATGGSG